MNRTMTGTGIADRPGDEVHEPLRRRACRRTTLTRSPSLRKPAPLSTMRSPASHAARRSRSACRARRRSRRGGARRLLSSLDDEHVAVAVLELTTLASGTMLAGARAEQRSRRARTCRDAAARRPAGRRRRAPVRSLRSRSSARRRESCRANGVPSAVVTLHALARRWISRSRDLGSLAAPFDAAVAQQAQHLGAGLRDLADGHGARGDDAVVGRGDVRELAAAARTSRDRPCRLPRARVPRAPRCAACRDPTATTHPSPTAIARVETPARRSRAPPAPARDWRASTRPPLRAGRRRARTSSWPLRTRSPTSTFTSATR